jgi:hypothetical protein
MLSKYAGVSTAKACFDAKMGGRERGGRDGGRKNEKERVGEEGMDERERDGGITPSVN